ncbi:MAG: STAS/SEC14 domain-containing protein [Legionellales bacterium]|nr:STAS/SEC14 domain-containing protein [Legionellales bacterium]|tara:strand:- start:685 stop:1062 length:378 start_codon:yes stop_codon:yes gene_type:complete
MEIPMITIETDSDSPTLLHIVVSGRLTHQDYQLIIPKINRIASHSDVGEIDIYINAIALIGWEPRALWDDIKLGFKYSNYFNNIAIYSNKKWLANLSGIGSWFVSGNVKHFTDSQKALNWINDKT